MISDTIHEHMKNIQLIKVKSLISKATTIDPTDTISSVINKITKNNCYDVFYLKDKNVFSTNIRSLLNAKNINKMKIESFLYPIPHVTQNESVQKVANIMAHYRIREVPVVDKNQIIGVVTSKQIITLLSSNDNKWIKANLIYTKNPITISSSESISNARRLMTNKRIDHLPVLNQGKIKQVLTSYHILQSIIPSEKQGRKSMIPKTFHALESNIGNLGSTRIPQCSANDDLNKIINLMLKTDTTCCLVNLWDTLQGIITYRDILVLLASKLETQIPLYIVGMPDDQENIELINSKFAKILKRLQNVYSEIHEARVSIKQQRTGNKKEGKFEVTVMIIISHHTPLIFSSIGFDLSEVLEDLSQKLLRTLSKRAKNRSKDSIRKIGLPIF
ncbi:CBS domain-containing protein [Nitrosarchaeum sp. AC2]|uniref:CBS domain-containing protein n=1 Tax=Nitrosarchaeum sp. AC2 TaxID=2259673 RepID=UPI0015C762C6|nr:CBS domain-containing protein [Nitrosarchaeum sp. AC2]QLH10096.1 histidine kinase [Nitrosarchaeum sp. AC2]